jgi:hypothetical protein
MDLTWTEIAFAGIPPEDVELGDTAADAVLETVYLEYPGCDSKERYFLVKAKCVRNVVCKLVFVHRFTLAIPTRKDEYDPLNDLRNTAACIVEFCLPGTTGKPLGDVTSGILRGIIKSCKRRNRVELKDHLSHFNQILRDLRPKLDLNTTLTKGTFPDNLSRW